MALLETFGEVLFEKTIFGIPNIVVGVAAVVAARSLCQRCAR